MHNNLNSDARRSTRPVHNPVPHRQRSDPKPPDAPLPVHGHIRHPVLAREPTALESIRTITNTALRNLPAVFSPAATNTTSPASQQRSTVSSYGSFVPGTSATAATTAINTHRGPNPNPYPPPFVAPSSNTATATTVDHLPIEPENELITWASWDHLPDGKQTRVLVLGYQSGGLQVWDITSIDTLQEILNINLMSFIASDGLWIVNRAVVLPNPRARNDDFAEARPLLAIIAKEVSQPHSGLTEVLIYSLRTHTVVKRLGAFPLDDPKFGTEASSLDGSDPGEDFCSAVDVVANPNFVAITTHSPHSIHILSATTLHHLFTIPPEALTPSTSSSNPNKRVPPRPTFALSSRFIAYASPPPLPHHRPRNSILPSSSAASSVASGFSPTLSAIGAGSMDLVGTGAKKVGEGVWMGMKALSGLAFGGSNQATAPPPPPVPHSPYSRSAPHSSFIAGGGTSPSPPGMMTLSPGPPRSKRSSFGGVPSSGESVLNPPAVDSGYVTILDLSPLGLGHGAKPVQIAHFIGTPPASSVIPNAHVASAVQHLSFSPSGTMLCVSDVTGHVAKVFQIRGSLRGLRSSVVDVVVAPLPSPGLAPRASSAASRRRSSGASSTSSANTRLAADGAVWHMYDLARGTTSAKVDSVCWAEDGRWIGVGTTRGTLHVFGINPYGGKPDDPSHLGGRVMNPKTLQSWPATVHPVIRLKATSKEGSPSPIFRFLSPAISRSSSLLSPSFDKPRGSGLGRSSSLPGAESAFGSWRTGFQDVLGFASSTGLLTLRRCNFSIASPVTGPVDAARRPPGAGDFSRSLPVSGVSMMMNLVSSSAPETGLKASETLVASWDLRREPSWAEVKDVISPGRPSSHRVDQHTAPLAQAELSTNSRSPQILPPSLYVSHQFNFFALREDWHALLRGSQLDLPIRKVEVRKEVEVTPQGCLSAGHSLPGESFFQDADDMVAGTSIEQPIATAIQTNIDPQAAPMTMPSFPNAYKPSSWRDTIVPVRTVAAGVADGVNEGLGRIKREIHKARAPPATRTGLHEGQEVPSLVFEDDDEAIFAQDREGDGVAEEDVVAATIEPPVPGGSSGSTIQTDEGSIDDHAWSEKDDEIAKVLADEACFDDIGVSGFMLEEEQERQRELADAAPKSRKSKGRGGKKGKK